MKKFFEFINEELEVRKLKPLAAFTEGKCYITTDGASWLVESVEDEEIVATNQETQETQTFTPDEFAQQVDVDATAKNDQTEKEVSKLNQAAQNLMSLGLQKIAQGQQMCDNCSDKESVEFKQGQQLQAQGYKLLKQAEELKQLDQCGEQLTLAQQIQQFKQCKDAIEAGQKIVEQAQLILTDIKELNKDNLCQAQEVIAKAQDLVKEGCEAIIQGQKQQNKETLISQQEGNQQLAQEVQEQIDALKEQTEQLEKQANEFIGQSQEKEDQEKAAAICQAAQQMKSDAAKVEVQLKQEDEQKLQQEQEQDKPVNQEESEQEFISKQLKQAEDEIEAAQVIQAQDDSEEAKQTAQDLEDIANDLQDAQELVAQEQTEEQRKLLEEKIKVIDAKIRKLTEEKETEVDGQKFLTQSQTVINIKPNIEVVKQAIKNIGEKLFNAKQA